MLHIIAGLAKGLANLITKYLSPAVVQEVPPEVITIISSPEQLAITMFTRVLRGDVPSAAEAALLVGAVAISLIARHLKATHVASPGAAPLNA